MKAGGSLKLSIASYAVSGALFVFGLLMIGTLLLLEQIFGENDAPVPREAALEI